MLRAKDTGWGLPGRVDRTADSGAAARTPVINNDPNMTAILAKRFTASNIIHSNDDSSLAQR